MKILLINPSSNFLINDKVFPPLGLLYLSAYLKENGYHDISLLDLSGGAKIPAEIDYDVVGITATTPQIVDAKDIIEKHSPRCIVFFQPVWGTDPQKLASWILRDGLQVRLSVQLHKIIWGNKRGV